MGSKTYELLLGKVPPARPIEASESAQPVVAFVGALARAVRALSVYDAKDRLMRPFLAELQASAEEAASRGPLALEVAPFDVLHAEEVVYHEDDRERSLAFRLYSDGVRRITFRKGIAFGELVDLLKILGVRMMDVRSAEEDFVSLFRKKGFQGIRILVDEGYVPVEELAESPAGREEEGVGITPGYDRPFPQLPRPAPLAYRVVPEDHLALLRADESELALARNALKLGRELIALTGEGALEHSELISYLCELREYLLASGSLEELADLVDLASSLPLGELRSAILRSVADAHLLDALLSAVPAGATDLSPEAHKLVPLISLEAVLDRLVGERSVERRQVLVQLSKSRLGAEVDLVLARLHALPAEAAREMWRAIASEAPLRADDVPVALIDHANPALRLEALKAVATLERGLPAEPFLRLLNSSEEALRIAAAEALARHGDAAAARAVAAALTERNSYSVAEAEVLGRALGRLHPVVAERLFDEWLEKKGRLRDAFSSGKMRAELLRFAAVSGLGVLDVPDAEERIRAAAEKSDPEMKRHCLATLARRRVEEKRRG